MKSVLILGLAVVLASGSLAAAHKPAPAPASRSLRADHPMLGAWAYTGDDGCVETWRLDRSGLSLVTSADEVAEVRFTLSDQPSARGFYKWTDTLFKDNGKKDCLGHVTKPPRSTTQYILMNEEGDQFVFCTAEDGKRCFGPFVKEHGGEI